MSRDNAFLLDILLMTQDAVEFAKGMDKNDFLSDRKSHSAVIRCLEVIGEATKRLSNDFQKQHPEIPWSRMARMRDFLIHAYGRVSSDRR